LHRYEAYRLANPKGLTVQELEPESRAAAEIAALWEWLSAEVQLSTGAHVHMGVV
jgi:chromosome partitioning protein